MLVQNIKDKPENIKIGHYSLLCGYKITTSKIYLTCRKIGCKNKPSQATFITKVNNDDNENDNIEYIIPLCKLCHCSIEQYEIKHCTILITYDDIAMTL